MRRWGFLMLVVFGFLSGLGIMLYPAVSNFLLERHQSTAMQGYIEEQEKVPDEISLSRKAEAQEYNRQLYQGNITGKYEDILDPAKNGLMGYMEIPSISVYLPVYHGTSDGTLQSGIGHVKNTSLPIGGESTHAVLSGHTGLPGARLLTDLDKLQEGDQFYFHVLDEVLAYEVDQIRIVEPDDVQTLQIEEGEDHVTLVTCTPYGINSHRLLVRGTRVPYVAEHKEQQVSRETESTWKQAYGQAVLTGIKWAGLSLGVLLILLFLTGMRMGVPAVQAAPNGRIQIICRIPMEFQLYRVGEVQDPEHPVLNPSYGITEYPATAETTELAVKSIRRSLTGKPQATAVTDQNGQAVFSGLGDGVYYIEATASEQYGIVEPLLICIPSMLKAAENEENLSRDVTAEPKIAERVEKKVLTEKKLSVPETVEQKVHSPKTGDTNSFIGYILLLLSAICMIVWVSIKITGI